MPLSLRLLVRVQFLQYHLRRLYGGLAVVSVTEPLALPWVALGTATPFILGYRVVGDKIVISQAPKYITESLAKTEMIEMAARTHLKHT
jgi:hypothetical protein